MSDASLIARVLARNHPLRLGISGCMSQQDFRWKAASARSVAMPVHP